VKVCFRAVHERACRFRHALFAEAFRFAYQRHRNNFLFAEGVRIDHDAGI
jgi:hypothetical protein